MIANSRARLIKRWHSAPTTPATFGITPLLVALALMLLSTSRLFAQDICTDDTLEKMKSIDASKISGSSANEIKQVQACLVEKHCYKNDPDKIDGKFGRYTREAFSRFTSGRCFARETPIEPEGPIFCALTDECFKKLSSGAACTISSSSQGASKPIVINRDWLPEKCEDPGEPSIQSKTLAEALSPMKNVSYPSPELFVSQMKFLACNSTKASIKNDLEAKSGNTQKWESITQASCHPYNQVAQTRSWTLDWDVPMSRELSDPVYGFHALGTTVVPAAVSAIPNSTSSSNLSSSNGNSQPAPVPAGVTPSGPTQSGSSQNSQNPAQPAPITPPAANPAPSTPQSGSPTNSGAANQLQPTPSTSPGSNPGTSAQSNQAQSPSPQNAPSSPGSENNPNAAEKIDLGTLSRVEWFSGVTINDTMQLQPSLPVRPKENIELARRFDVKVDLVIYKRASDNWLKTVKQSPARIDLINSLASSIAEVVGKPESGFLNATQRFILPSVLTIAPTHWDGVTLYFDDFPFDDDNALDFLVQLIHQTRLALDQKQAPHNFRKSNPHLLALNVVIPFCSLLKESDNCNGFKSDPAKLLQKLIKLVPATWPGSVDVMSDSALSPHSRKSASQKDCGDQNPERSCVDSLLVFLPQPTSENKKSLRYRVEKNFEQVKIKKANKVYAHTRAQILRRIVYVLSPTVASNDQGQATDAGQVQQSHLTDDMIYAKENFGGVGFWLLPGYGQPKMDENKDFLAREIRAVFIDSQTGAAPSVWRARIENFFFACRREIFVFVEAIVLALLAYAGCAFWLFELRDFFHSHLLWFAGLVLALLGILSLLFESNPDLQKYLAGFIVGIVLAAVIALAGWAYFGKLEKDLP